MKKTLITLMALASCAMGATISTTPEYTDNEGGNYCGVAFTLGSLDPARATIVDGVELDPVVGLFSISLTERNNGSNIPVDRVLYVTDANNVLLGSSSLYTKAEGSDVAVFNFGNSITLNTTDTYYAYLNTADTVAGWTVGETVAAGQFYSSALAAVGGNSLTAATASSWGFLNAQKNLASTGFAPVMSIETTIIPEPATATLSLLALAGLAARRRRK